MGLWAAYTFFPFFWNATEQYRYQTSKTTRKSVRQFCFDLTHFSSDPESPFEQLNPVEPLMAWMHLGGRYVPFQSISGIKFSKLHTSGWIEFRINISQFRQTYLLLKLLCCHPHSVMLKLDKRNKVRNETAMLWAILHPRRIQRGHHFSLKLPIFHTSCNNTRLVVFPGNFHKSTPLGLRDMDPPGKFDGL